MMRLPRSFWRNSASMLACGLFATAAGADMVVYENVANSSGGLAVDPADEIGEAVTLGGVDRVLTSFEFSYGGSFDQDGDETVTLRLYANDGPGGEPGSLLFATGPQPIAPAQTASVYIFDGLSAPMPDTFTWTLDFGGTSTGSDRPVLFFAQGPPAIGSSDPAFFYYCCWFETDFFSVNNFYARIQALPEPAFQLPAGLLLLSALTRRATGARLKRC